MTTKTTAPTKLMNNTDKIHRIYWYLIWVSYTDTKYGNWYIERRYMNRAKIYRKIRIEYNNII